MTATAIGIHAFVTSKKGAQMVRTTGIYNDQGQIEVIGAKENYYLTPGKEIFSTPEAADDAALSALKKTYLAIAKRKKAVEATLTSLGVDLEKVLAEAVKAVEPEETEDGAEDDEENSDEDEYEED